MDMSIGEFIEMVRKRRKLTQKQLGDAIGVSDKVVSKWEKDVYLPDITMLVPLSEALKITTHELLTRTLDSDVNSKKHRKRNTLVFFLECLIIILITIIVILSTNIRKIENQPVSMTNVYKISSNDKKLSVDGYIVEKESNYITIINGLSIQDEGIGTSNNFIASRLFLEIKSNDKTLINLDNDVYDYVKENTTISEVLKHFKTNSHLIILDKKVDLNTLKLKLTFLDNKNNKKEFIYDLILKLAF